MEKISAIIMASGNDARMKSKKSKFVQNVYGKPVIQRVVEEVSKTGIEDIFVVVGENEEEIRDVLEEKVQYVKQEEYLGSADAIKQVGEKHSIQGDKIIVLNGNIPLITAKAIDGLIDQSYKENSDLTIMTTTLKEPYGYGRIVRDQNKIVQILEEYELTENEKQMNEVNGGIYCFALEKLFSNLNQIQKNNMGMYSITDIVEIMSQNDEKVSTLLIEDHTQLYGLNNKVQLELLNKIMKIRINTYHMNQGVTIEDMNSTYIYEDVKIGMDTVIHPNTVIKSNVTMGENCEIGPNSYIRENCVLADNVKIGSFCEIKKVNVGEGTKIPHLSYIGDAIIGKKCNIGCGTITCNYDGTNKSKTVIGDYGFIGSNVNLVAPVTLGDNVFVAAGSTITDDVPDDSLAIARQRQTNKEGWNKR